MARILEGETRRGAGTSRTGTGTEEQPKLDGRRERTSRTRQAIIDAVISLQEAGEARAPAAAIVARAGVSLRSLFVHFPRQELLTLAVMDDINGRLLKNAITATPDGGLEERIDRFLDLRIPLLEKLVAYRRSAAAMEPLPQSVHARRRAVRLQLRNEVAIMFAPELRAAGKGRGKLLLNAIAVTTESECWDNLRRNYGTSAANSRSTIRLMLTRMLGLSNRI